MIDTEVRAKLQNVAKLIDAQFNKENTFALFVFSQGKDGKPRLEYVANGKREEIWHGVAEWIVANSHKPLGDN